MIRTSAMPVELWMGNKVFGEGVLIDDDCVLTAGHCIVGLKIYQTFHEDDPWIQLSEDKKRYAIKHMKITPSFHTPSPKLNSGEFHQDWGLIVLTEAIPDYEDIAFKYTTGPSVDVWSPDAYRKGNSGQGVWDDEENTLIGVHSRTTQQGWSFNTLVTQELVEVLKHTMQ